MVDRLLGLCACELLATGRFWERTVFASVVYPPGSPARMDGPKSQSHRGPRLNSVLSESPKKQKDVNVRKKFAVGELRGVGGKHS